MKNRKAFTLIELLIVVAIIAILAAIAVPNFLESQMRAKVARAKNDMRSIATALEAYRVDTNRYPSCAADFNGMDGLRPVTTPIAYITRQNIEDIFRGQEDGGVGLLPYYNYAGRDVDGFSFIGNGIVAHSWFVYSNGPDLRPASLIFQTAIDTDNFELFVNTIYDPTNGIISDGNIYRSGGRFHGPGARAGLYVSAGDTR